jgi:hypothetical protein
VAALVHAIATFAVLTATASATRQTEHVSPTATARLAEEGVADPDAHLSDLVEEYSGIESGENVQRDDPSEAPARATTQHRSAITPAGVPTEPAGPSGRHLDDRSPRRYRRWAARAVCAVIAVGAFVVLMGVLAGEL